MVANGTRLGPYEIVSPIGAGGMGEVYKARDTRLDRSVAVKILSAEFAQNAQLKLRFEREAKTISQLNHPHICTLFDVGDDYLVMELIEGESLAERLAKGAMPLADVLKYGAQIADALDRAHRSGVIHRDLKPGNVMITRSGAKLLDFGLAKSGMPVISADAATIQKSLTAEGTILGTFQYMAPEQLEGDDADARTDIFGLGAVLYEMLTGRRAFDGKTRTSLIAAIVAGTPRPLAELQPLTPPALEHVIAKCLNKDPEDRWQNAHDIAQELRWIAEGGGAVAAVAPAQLRRRGIVAVMMALVAALAAAGGWMAARPRTTPASPIFSAITAPPGTDFAFDSGPAVISPHGHFVVFVAKPKEGESLLYIRPLDAPSARPLHGTEGATFPFWSPDERSIAFFADAKLKRIEAAGGPADVITDAANGRGGSWGPDGTIIFSPSASSGIYRVPATGGPATVVTTIDPKRGDTSHRFATFLPDGKHFLAFIQGAVEGGNVLLASLDGGPARLLTSADGSVAFAPPDVLLSTRERALRAQRLDMKALRLIGEPQLIADDVQLSNALNFANISAADDGVLTYVAGGSASMAALAYFDKDGKEVATIGQPADWLDPRVAPDGHAIVAARPGRSGGGTSDIWAIDPLSGAETRLTFTAAQEFGGTWSPDSKSVAYTTFEHSPGDIFVKRVDGSGAGEPLYTDAHRKIVSDWSRDGKYLLFHSLSAETQWDINAYSFATRTATPLLHGKGNETLGHVSPDGKWLAYATDESGKTEIYVCRFPEIRDRVQISGGGGTMPAWSPDGRELYYIASDGKMMVAAVHPGAAFSADAPRAILGTRVSNVIGITRNQYDVAPDGRFVTTANATEKAASPPIMLLQNFLSKSGAK